MQRTLPASPPQIPVARSGSAQSSEHSVEEQIIQPTVVTKDKSMPAFPSGFGAAAPPPGGQVRLANSPASACALDLNKTSAVGFPIHSVFLLKTSSREEREQTDWVTFQISQQTFASVLRDCCRIAGRTLVILARAQPCALLWKIGCERERDVDCHL